MCFQKLLVIKKQIGDTSMNILDIFLGSDPIVFVIIAEEFGIEKFPLLAHIPITVLMQLQSAEDTRSVGANASPFPLLSVGASVITLSPDFRCVDEVLRFPMYLYSIVWLILLKFYAFRFILKYNFTLFFT